MNAIKRIFKKDKVIVGVIHFTPLLGFDGFEGLNTVLDKALEDLEVLQKSDIDGIVLENNYDLPHKIIVGAETVASMTYLAGEIIKRTKLPIGISVLWNDYKAALSISKVCGAKFVRIPVFVDHVMTSYGEVEINPREVKEFQTRIEAEGIALFTDIHVKHAEIINKDTLIQSAEKAINFGSDGLIITGKWTGDAPILEDLKQVKEQFKDFPVIVGSGVDYQNIPELISFADGMIVSTSLKRGEPIKDEVNVKGYDQRLDLLKGIELVKAFRTSLEKV